MVTLMEETYCIPCQWGSHEEHIEYPETPSPGVMGGWHCPCKGECKEHPQEQFDSAVDHRQEVYSAHLAVVRAEAERRVAIANALKAGETCRGLAPLLGVGSATVWRWSDLRQRG